MEKEKKEEKESYSDKMTPYDILQNSQNSALFNHYQTNILR